MGMVLTPTNSLDGLYLFPIKNHSSILLDLFKYKGAARISNIMGRKHWVLFGNYIATA